MRKHPWTARPWRRPYVGGFRFVEESDSAVGIRRPQNGAMHAILAYRSTEECEPITVAMPNARRIFNL